MEGLALSEPVGSTREQRFALAANVGQVALPLPSMQGPAQTVERISAMDHPVLVYGESGAGKTFLGRLIHGHSRRSDSNFVSIDCACMSKAEVERKLFGLRGRGKRPSLIDRAKAARVHRPHRTVSPRCQSRLFRALSEAPRNDAATSYAPFRLIASTHSRLEPLVESGKFSKDLYYRIHVFSIHLPPLRERPEDAISLAEGFLQEFSQMTGAPDFARQRRAHADQILPVAGQYPRTEKLRAAGRGGQLHACHRTIAVPGRQLPGQSVASVQPCGAGCGIVDAPCAVADACFGSCRVERGAAALGRSECAGCGARKKRLGASQGRAPTAIDDTPDPICDPEVSDQGEASVGFRADESEGRDAPGLRFKSNQIKRLDWRNPTLRAAHRTARAASTAAGLRC